MAEDHDFAVATRDPEKIHKTRHFDDAYEDPMRFVTPDMVRETIETGEGFPSEGGHGKERRRKDYNGVVCCLVIAHDHEPPLLVTAWTEIRSRARALASGEWTLDELSAIQQFMDRGHTRHGAFRHNGSPSHRPLDVELKR